jgi:hypothetical protein
MEAGLAKVARLYVTRRFLIVDIEDGDLFRHRYNTG